jgi:hypothetical protein
LQQYAIKFAAVHIGEAAAAKLSVFGAFGSWCNQPDQTGCGRLLKDSAVFELRPVLNF